MQKGANIINAIQNLKMAQEQFDDFCRQYPGTKGYHLFKGYSKRIDFIFTDVITHPYLTDEVREGIKKEIASDVFAVPAIIDKIGLVTPEQREMIELTLDAMLAGEEIKIIDINETK